MCFISINPALEYFSSLVSHILIEQVYYSAPTALELAIS